MSSIDDPEVQDYIDKIKLHNYDSNYKEIIDYVRNMIKDRKRLIQRNYDFAYRRYIRLDTLIENISADQEDSNAIAIYDEFLEYYNNADYNQISTFVNDTNDKINISIGTDIHRLNMYQKEYDDLSKRLLFLQSLIDFYDESDSSLSDLRGKLESITLP